MKPELSNRPSEPVRLHQEKPVEDASQNATRSRCEQEPVDRDRLRTLEQVKALFRLRYSQIDAAIAPIIREVQRDFDAMAGMCLDTVEENKSLTLEIQGILRRLMVRLECKKDNCTEPAGIRFLPNPSEKGVLGHFKHYHPGKSHGGPPLLPSLKIKTPVLAEAGNAVEAA